MKPYGWQSSRVTSDSTWPSEGDIEAQWVALIKGERTREQVHEWTIPWVEGDAPGWHEGLRHIFLTGLTTLHGFSMAHDPAAPRLVHHGPPGVYVKTDEDIAAGLARWIDQR